jgi:hypothetical protein
MHTARLQIDNAARRRLALAKLVNGLVDDLMSALPASTGGQPATWSADGTAEAGCIRARVGEIRDRIEALGFVMVMAWAALARALRLEGRAALLLLTEQPVHATLAGRARAGPAERRFVLIARHDS